MPKVDEVGRVFRVTPDEKSSNGGVVVAIIIVLMIIGAMSGGPVKTTDAPKQSTTQPVNP